MSDNRIGDAPIQPELHDLMEGIAHGLDELLNRPDMPKRVGFILMTFNFSTDDRGVDDTRCNYIANCKRDDVVVLLREQLHRFEGQAESQPGHA